MRVVAGLILALAACAAKSEELVIAPAAGRVEGGLAAAQASGAPAALDAANVQEALDLLRKAQAGDEQAQRAWEARPAGTRVRALAAALDGGSEALRRRAVKELDGQELSGLEDELARAAARTALARATLLEPREDLRERAREAWVEEARAAGKPALEEVAQGLRAGNPVEARRAFEALKAAGGRAAAEVLVTKVVRRWGRGPRGHFMYALQRSYIADYDVSGAVFDPVIKSYFEGVVLDNRVLGIEIVDYLIEFLRAEGAGDEVLKNPAAWPAFIQAERPKPAR
ncbi:MAG: hypothetical protein M5U26_20375 [Planctomycetota bacterium]|nr:hypothetical protein [Planctomycetota bacterium]